MLLLLLLLLLSLSGLPPVRSMCERPIRDVMICNGRDVEFISVAESLSVLTLGSTKSVNIECQNIISCSIDVVYTNNERLADNMCKLESVKIGHFIIQDKPYGKF